MADSPAQTRAGRALALTALLLAMALISVAVGATMADHGHKRDSLVRALRGEAREQAKALDDYFGRARSLTLVTANNPAYREFYELPGTREQRIRAASATVEDTQQGLAYLAGLFPDSIGEACFIDRGGAENARAVRGAVEPRQNLSPDERAAPFFEPSFDLPAGEVYQARPYLSPDTGEWVVSNSAPVLVRLEDPPAIVHFEVTMENFRRQAADTSGSFDIAIVEAASGQVVADSRYPQRAGDASRLGRPGDRRFARMLSTAGAAFGRGETEVAGRPSAFHALPRAEHNANRWVVVATARSPASSWVSELGLAELAMIAFAMLLLGFGVLTLRSSQAQLHRAAVSDPLTGLGNRRRLVHDLDRLVPQASDANPLLLGLFDLDGFKAYNDSYGHPAGDALLVRLSCQLDAAMGSKAGVYRMGGDEFCVLARVQPGAERFILERAAAALVEHGEGFTVSASYGSILVPLETSSPAEALRIADQRMYAAKSGNRASAGRQTTDVLVRVLAERYPEIGEHLDDVTALCARVADRLELPVEERAALLQAASLHDIGKAAVPDAILSKPGPLDEEEWAFMRQHTVIGERILAAAPALTRAAQLVRWSHERHDGSGYPDRLAADEIPLGARIIAVCDAFDAMTRRRPYRPTPMSIEGALAELDRCAGTQFDPQVVAAFRPALVAAPSHSLNA